MATGGGKQPTFHTAHAQRTVRPQRSPPPPRYRSPSPHSRGLSRVSPHWPQHNNTCSREQQRVAGAGGVVAVLPLLCQAVVQPEHLRVRARHREDRGPEVLGRPVEAAPALPDVALQRHRHDGHGVHEPAVRGHRAPALGMRVKSRHMRRTRTRMHARTHARTHSRRRPRPCARARTRTYTHTDRDARAQPPTCSHEQAQTEPYGLTHSHCQPGCIACDKHHPGEALWRLNRNHVDGWCPVPGPYAQTCRSRVFMAAWATHFFGGAHGMHTIHLQYTRDTHEAHRMREKAGRGRATTAAATKLGCARDTRFRWAGYSFFLLRLTCAS